ncbi:glycosyltransferase family 39 protein [Microcoleus sp. FACHB-1515]|uniref:glycosyltransferase family 39 protein n=1 Tax=Cyanophyceae TaxID=3028117 RepID=UPI00168651CD|nr:glycosyltransferase family 39 protein [Microcoleus sp. FACHB-1515]MBD2090443.1 glycosyltransferase family 39 protein [Microcoleus sp. FACHB-1515]
MLKFLLKRPRNRWVAGGILLALILGIFFRFYQLDRKVFWGDEVFTAMRSSGYGVAEVVDRTYTGEILDLADLQQYQHPAGRTWENTWDALVGNPEQAPLYYLLVRGWAQLFGADQVDVSPAGLARSIAIWRSFSAVVSLLALPLIYWLCSELFTSRATGWIAIALLAVSPFHVLFAQEARLYSLWTVTILLSSAVLLRTRQTEKGWWLYSLTLALSFYTFLFSGFVAIAHGIYILGLSGWRWSRSVAHYLAAITLALLLFSPWLIVMGTHLKQLRRNVAHLDQDSFQLPAKWLLNLSRLYFDFNHGPSWINPLTYATLILSGYALYWIYRYRAKRIWLFLFALIGVTGTVLILADLLLGGQRSSVARYPIACYLGIQLAVARLIAYKTLEWNWKKKWVIGFLALLLIGALSCGISSQAELWWNKGLFKTKDNLKIAAVVNQSDRPLILSNASIERVLSLSYSLKPEVQFQLVKPLLLTAPPIDRDLFLYQASPRLRRQLIEQYRAKLEPLETESLWKVTLRKAQ